MVPDFTPQCPFRNGALCNYRCGLALWQKENGFSFCALAVSVALGKPEFGINALRLPEELLEEDDGEK